MVISPVRCDQILLLNKGNKQVSASNAPKLPLVIMALILPLAGCSLPIWPFEEETDPSSDRQALVTHSLPAPMKSEQTAPDETPVVEQAQTMAAPIPPVTPVDKLPEMVQPADQKMEKVLTQPQPQPKSHLITSSGKEQHGYYVQLASYRRQMEAERGWRRLQTAYPAVLGQHKPQIRRAELHERGVFYRLNVSGFDDIGQSVALCNALISAGGDCIVKEPG